MPVAFPFSEHISVSVVVVRMWSRTSIVQDVQAELAGLGSASVSTRGKRKTSCAT